MKFSLDLARLRKIGLAGALLFVFLPGCSPETIKKTTMSVWRKQRGTQKKKAVPTRLEWRSRPEMPKAGLPALWSLKILDLRTDKDNPKGILAYDAPHSVAMHLFIVSQDGTEYGHFYPEPRDYGNFLVRPVIPAAGSYELFVDFIPIDGFATVHSQKFIVSGEKPVAKAKWVADKAQGSWLERKVQAREEQSFVPSKDAAFYSVQLENIHWQAGKKLTFKARVFSANNVPVTDLQLHLGAAAYGVAFRENGGQLVRLEAAPRAKGAFETEFGGTFPLPGLYKIWLEFSHLDKIIVAPFTIRVI